MRITVIAFLQISLTKYWCNSSFRSFSTLAGSQNWKKSQRDAKEEPLYLYDNVYMKLLHDFIYDPLTQTKRTLRWFARLTINSVSGCFRRFSGKFLKQTERLKRHSVIFLVGKFQAEIRISCLQTFLNISLRLSQPFFLKRNWLRQMANAITERNQNSSVLNSVHHLPAQTVKRPVYPCKK